MNFQEKTEDDPIMIPSFFQGDFWGSLEKMFSEKYQKYTISGLPNISAKLFFLQKFLERHQQVKNVLFIVEEKNELHEIVSLAPLFLSHPQKENRFYNLPITAEREKEKIEWTLQLLRSDSTTQNIYFCTKQEAIEHFPSPEQLQEQRITLQKGQKISTMQLFNELIALGYSLTADVFLQKGEYRRSGDVIDIFPVGAQRPLKIEIAYDEVESIHEFFPDSKKIGQNFETLEIHPLIASTAEQALCHIFTAKDLMVWNELEDISKSVYETLSTTTATILEISSFPENEETAVHYHYLSVLKFYNLSDLLLDFRQKIAEQWKMVVFTKRTQELQGILQEENIPFSTTTEQTRILLRDAKNLEVVPPSFQNQAEKICFLTDREIFHLHGKKKKQISTTGVNVEFLTSLKVGDLVVHLDHGIGRFLGICEQEIDQHIREYLEIAYLHDDKLFVPVDQADKVSRFISEDGQEPKLTRLGGVEWKNIQRKVKKETEKIAKELLSIYARRAKVKALKLPPDSSRQEEFEKAFPYEETPGQIAAIGDMKMDLESDKPMDRLICGDVGFGKTEVAMRAAFKVVDAGKQVAMIAPITILVHQHFHSFKKRMESFDVRIEMLSRFRTPAQQKNILEDLAKGKLDIVIGTHRLLSTDVQFHDLGLVIIDEEQRFGVKQKERFKKLRSEVSIMTLSATPIPRTLNLALHKLRDISTITTPPPGRRPIITEVRKYSDKLIRDAILTEKARGGQVYFLHNRVETIETMAHKLRQVVPEATFIVAHGQMKSELLEDRILGFKNKQYDVLVSSTIIENGIDLANANTMIVNNAENFGLSQLYQLRGRIGRSQKQAYAYLLHSAQKLSLNAKKRLKALIEASELGSGFQLSMRDLEIRGAGDILGVSQHGTVNVVGVSHFLRLLQQTIKEMEAGQVQKGKEEEPQDVLMEVPLDAYIPNTYISDTKEKILTYQKLAAVQTLRGLQELAEELAEEYGRTPPQVENLYTVLKLKLLARKANLRSVRAISSGHNKQEMHLALSKKVTAVEIMNLLQFQTNWKISGEILIIDMKQWGFNWTNALQEALEKLAPQPKTKQPAAPPPS